jgi:hypothetical protein
MRHGMNNDQSAGAAIGWYGAVIAHCACAYFFGKTVILRVSPSPELSV